MSEIILEYILRPKQMPKVVPKGVTLSESDIDRLRTELNGKYKDFVAQDTGVYRVSTDLPYGLNKVEFRFRCVENPDSDRDPIVRLEGDLPEEPVVPRSSWSSARSYSAVASPAALVELRASLDADNLSREDRDLRDVIDAFLKHSRTMPEAEQHYLTLIGSIVRDLSREKPEDFYSQSHLIGAARAFARRDPEYADLPGYLEGTQTAHLVSQLVNRLIEAKEGLLGGLKRRLSK
jgi:hypothetical protein